MSELPQVHPNVVSQLRSRKTYRPYFIYIVSIVQLILFIITLTENQKLTGSLVQPFDRNPMIGPTTSVLIRMGARYIPCMKQVKGIDTTTRIMCEEKLTEGCRLSDLCGFGYSEAQPPNQWFRFITPIFLHGGILHLVFNLMFQLGTGAQLEREFGFVRMALIYMTSGIGGFLFGGLFSSPLVPSIGASGSLFGLLACLLIDILFNWRLIKKPILELTKLVFILVLTFLTGLIPQIDNFSHIGGFLYGLLAGFAFMPILRFGKWDHRLKRIMSWVAIPLLILFLVLAGIGFVNNEGEKCAWCKSLNCLPALFDCSDL